MFRKIDDRSSEFYPHVNDLRREGSFIYETFLTTQGTDVKVYTVGPDYGHAEARKSPVVDGRVNRDSAGLEVRYPVILGKEEKEMAHKIVVAFKQTVCGFDILRVQGKSYCCDVNGFSFVKNSRKYYDDASQILTELMLTALRPECDATLSTRAPLMREVSKSGLRALGIRPKSFFLGSTPEPVPPSLPVATTPTTNGAANGTNVEETRPPSPTPSLVSTTDESYIMKRDEELRCIIAVIRHGDRTPKQKMKLKVTEPKYLEYFHSLTKNPSKELKVKSKTALVKFLEVTREILAASRTSSQAHTVSEQELYRKLRQIRDVLERWEISGINRKLQMKPQKWASVEATEGNGSSNPGGDSAPIHPPATELLVILKWGGDLTPLGREQAETVGANFRHDMYPDHEGGGVLRLHATFRHDLKIKASDEGRVMKTAAAFTKGLLELEGQLTPILASLVTIEEKNRQMLDKGGNFEIKADMDRCKDHLNLLQTDEEMDEELVQSIAPDCPTAVKNAMLSLKSPLLTLRRMHFLIGQICQQLQALCLKHGEEAIVVGNSIDKRDDKDREKEREKMDSSKLSAEDKEKSTRTHSLSIPLAPGELEPGIHSPSPHSLPPYLHPIWKPPCQSCGQSRRQGPKERATLPPVFPTPPPRNLTTTPSTPPRSSIFKKHCHSCAIAGKRFTKTFMSPRVDCLTYQRFPMFMIWFVLIFSTTHTLTFKAWRSYLKQQQPLKTAWCLKSMELIKGTNDALVANYAELSSRKSNMILQ